MEQLNTSLWLSIVQIFTHYESGYITPTQAIVQIKEVIDRKGVIVNEKARKKAEEGQELGAR